MNDQQQCAGCFQDQSGQQVCPTCGYDESAPRSPMLLPLRTCLAGQYLVGRELSPPGSFGISYLGWDQQRRKRVAIKEYLPRELALREEGSAEVVVRNERNRAAFDLGESQFLREAQLLKQFDHPNIVQVHAAFNAHGTAYLVTEFYDGMNLEAYLTQVCPSLDANTSVGLLKPILDGLQYAHERGLVHRDVNPRNVYLASIGRVILIDFGSVRQAIRDNIQSLSAVLAPGYAPLEQYQKDAPQDAATDVYGVAAVLYRAITGRAPPLALDRLASDPLEEGGYAQLPQVLQPVLRKALEQHAEDRYASAREFIRALDTCDPAELALPPSAFAPAADEAGAAAANAAVDALVDTKPVSAETPGAPPAATRSPQETIAAAPAIAAPSAQVRVPAGVSEVIELASKRPVSSPRPQRRYDDVPEDANAASRYVIVDEPVAKPSPLTPQRLRMIGIGAAAVLVIAVIGLLFKPSHHAAAATPAEGAATTIATASAATPSAAVAARPRTDEQTDAPVPAMVLLPGNGVVKPFRIGVTEVTVGQFRQFLQREQYANPRWVSVACETAPYTPQADWEKPGYSQSGNFPVVCVSRADARAYAAWLSRATGNAYRLPTEAEWDYANRGGSNSTYWWGSSFQPDNARCADCVAGAEVKSPEAVGSHPANAVGLFDTAGNVREWTCSPAGGEEATRRCAAMSDGGPSIIRGGSWHESVDSLRSSYRTIQDPDHRDSWTGFRLAQDVK